MRTRENTLRGSSGGPRAGDVSVGNLKEQGSTDDGVGKHRFPPVRVTIGTRNSIEGLNHLGHLRELGDDSGKRFLEVSELV